MDSAVASRQNFPTTQKNHKNPKNPTNRYFQNPRVPSDLPKYRKTKFLTKIRNFQNRQKSATSPFLTWLGGWDTDTHKHSAVASHQNFQTTRKTKKNKILISTKNQTNRHFQNPRVSSAPS